jgi:drug/metabolite transporter (DMT)-like permease
MTLEIVFALAASFFGAAASVLQRNAARPAPGRLRFSWRLIAFLLHRPAFFLGIVCMLAGFGFQLTALHFGPLALVQPVIASELLFVFAFLALHERGRVRGRDWAGAGGMAASLGGILYVADPRGGVPTVGDGTWWLIAAGATASGAVTAIGLAHVSFRGRAATPVRRAALLGLAASIVWGFVAAVVKELGYFAGQGAAAVFTHWVPYVLVAVGAAGLFLVANAFQAGPLAAIQPSLTIAEPLVSTVLGVLLFREHLRHGPGDVVAEAGLLAVMVVSVVVLARSPVVAVDVRAGPAGPRASAVAQGGRRAPGG